MFGIIWINLKDRHHARRRMKMDYKELIISIVKEINDEDILRILYKYVVAGQSESRERT